MTVYKLSEKVDATTEQEFDRKLKSGQLSAGIMRFTPALASYILENYNHGNRGIKPRKIAIYAADMRSKKWGVTGDTLKMGSDGYLKDGQNRLHACVEGGAAFTSFIAFGVDPKLFHKMDVGKPRTPADVLTIAGYKNAARLAAALRWASLMQDGAVESRRSFTPSETLQLARNIGDMEEDIKAAATIYALNRFPIGIGAALHREFSLVDAQKAVEFFAAWRQGIYKGRFRVLEKLNKALAEEKQRAQGRVHEFVYIALVIRAWNCFMDGRVGTSSDFRWDLKTDDLPKIGE